MQSLTLLHRVLYRANKKWRSEIRWPWRSLAPPVALQLTLLAFPPTFHVHITETRWLTISYITRTRRLLVLWRSNRLMPVVTTFKLGLVTEEYAAGGKYCGRISLRFISDRGFRAAEEAEESERLHLAPGAALLDFFILERKLSSRWITGGSDKERWNAEVYIPRSDSGSSY